MQGIALPILAGMAIGTVSTVGASVLAGKPKQAAAVPPPNPNVAADRARAEDALRSRRGTGANVLAGPGGAEPVTAGAKTLLGQ